MRVLVGYATAKGATRGIAERIATGLEQAGHTVDSRELSAVTSIGAYDVLVVGSAIHNGQWLPDAADALDRLGPDLGGRAVWAYSVSSVGASSSLLSPRVARYLRRVTPEPKAVQALRASAADVRGHRFFAGTIAPGDWPGVGRIVFRLMGGHYGDARDWADIDEWVATVRAESDDDVR
ncbi:flavodoxin domain-containing protein [Rhodococcus zopfii]